MGSRAQQLLILPSIADEETLVTERLNAEGTRRSDCHCGAQNWLTFFV
jgi:hypothetical protein